MVQAWTATRRWTKAAATVLGGTLQRVLRPTGRPSGTGYPGDFRGTAVIEYAPHPDRLADPGEIVWGWVPFEEDHRRGKDRPLLVIGRDGRWVLALMLTSKDHDHGALRQTDHGRVWMDLGSGAWDAQGRPSEVRLDRVIRVDPHGIRREGAVLDAVRFRQVADRVRAVHGWA